MNTIKNISLFGEKVDISYENGEIVSVAKSNDSAPAVHCIYPGLFDIHSHGMMGMDTLDSGAIEKMSRVMLSHGTTAWCPTTMTVGTDAIKKATDTLPDCEDGCKIVGYHLEGPYINEKYKGAQNPEYIRNPSLDEFRTFKNVAMITLAPELDGSMDFIENCGVPVCLGHTDCGYDIAAEAIDRGAKCLTHTFNAMTPIHHRDPGPIGAAAEKGIYAQVICDGIHIHKAAVLMLYKLFGSDRMILISDSVRPAGLEDGEYELGGLNTIVKNHIARLADGTLAGSTSFLYDCVKKAIEFGIPEKEAFKMASETPYNMCGIKNGRIEKGYPADFIITDKDRNITSVIKSGKEFNF